MAVLMVEKTAVQMVVSMVWRMAVLMAAYLVS
jgi:hypothetical protein